jgi:hypothetical protein
VIFVRPFSAATAMVSVTSLVGGGVAHDPGLALDASSNRRVESAVQATDLSETFGPWPGSSLRGWTVSVIAGLA